LALSALGQSTLNVSDLLFGLADTRHCSRNVIILTSAVCFSVKGERVQLLTQH